MAQSGGAKHKRRFRNYLLDRRFQLKYSGFMVAVATVLSLALGAILFVTSNALVEQSREAVTQGQQVVVLGQQVAAESRKVSAVVQMNIVKEYGDSPELLEAFKNDEGSADNSLIKQQGELQQRAMALEEQSVQLASRQRALLVAIVGVLLVLIFGIGIAGIIVTHKIAGPIFKMTRQLRTLGDGDWRLPDPLRKGDELVEFFGAFRLMVGNLRQRREQELALVEEAIGRMTNESESAERASLESLRDSLKAPLES